MKITAWKLYWITRLDNIICLIGGMSFFSFISITIIMVWPSTQDTLIIQKWALWLYFIPIGGFIVNNFIPSTKEMAAIIFLPEMTNNEKISKLPNQILDLATEWLEELKPKKETKK